MRLPRRFAPRNDGVGLFTVKMHRPGELPCRDRPPCRSMERDGTRSLLEARPHIFMGGGGLRPGHECLRAHQIWRFLKKSSPRWKTGSRYFV